MTIRLTPVKTATGLSSRRPRRLPLLLVGFFILLALPTATLAQRKTLRVSYPAPATVYLPLWVASDAGLFKKNGVEVELVHVGSSPIAMAAYLAGEIDILGGGGSAGPNAYLRGQRDLVFFGSMNSKFVFSVYAHPSIANMAGVRGKRVGVTRFGGTMDFATRHFFRQNGFDPGPRSDHGASGQSSGHLVGANRRIVGCGHHGVSLRYQGEGRRVSRTRRSIPERRQICLVVVSRAASVSRSEQGASRGFRARNHRSDACY